MNNLHSRHVSRAFDLNNRALECCHSADYQKALKHRRAASDTDIVADVVIVEGVA